MLRVGGAGRTSFLTLASLLLPALALAHQSVLEPSRLRQDNFDQTTGFAAPWNGGRCPLGSGQCNFAEIEDWSAEFPVNIIESTRISGAGAPGVSGRQVPCSSDLDCPVSEVSCAIPFFCPPSNAGPYGQCILTGPNPGWCDQSPGSPRPRLGITVGSRLVGPDDVDWLLLEYQPGYGRLPVIAVPSVPGCEENIDQFPTVAIAGPREVIDQGTGEPAFQRLEDVGWLPPEVWQYLKSRPRYGIRVTRPPWDFRPSRTTPRPGFNTIFGPSASLYNKGTEIDPCIEGWEQCYQNDEHTHFQHNDVILVEHDEPVDIFIMIWDDSRLGGPNEVMAPGWAYQAYGDAIPDWIYRGYGKTIRDVSVVSGTRDQFTAEDWARSEIRGQSSGSGRNNRGPCNDPRPSGRTDILME